MVRYEIVKFKNGKYGVLKKDFGLDDRLEKILEKELAILSRLDPIDDREQYGLYQQKFIEDSTKYIKRYENYIPSYINPSRLSDR